MSVNELSALPAKNFREMRHRKTSPAERKWDGKPSLIGAGTHYRPLAPSEYTRSWGSPFSLATSPILGDEAMKLPEYGPP
jgi:hypothetical protein